MRLSSQTLRAMMICAAAISCTCAVMVARAESNEETEVRQRITVSASDVKEANNIKSSLFHVTPAHVDGAKERVAALHAENAKRAEDAGIREAAQAAAIPSPSSPYFYPADLGKGTGSTLKTATHHALYVDYTGTIAANWGNPEGFLRDLNASTFVHLLDQYTGTTANGRYPVGGNAGVTYGFYGNVIYEHDIYAIVHAGAKLYGSGVGRIYHVFLPKGIDTCFDLTASCYSPDNPSTWAFCAYHDAVTFSDIGTVLFTVEPYQDVPGCAVQTPSPNGQLADSTNSVLSHETFETITDPIPPTAFINRIDLDLNGAEIGDECQPLGNSSGDFLTPTFKIDGKNYEVQLEYSNTYHACAAQP